MDEEITYKKYKEGDLHSEIFELLRPRIRVCWEVMPRRYMRGFVETSGITVRKTQRHNAEVPSSV